jgi:hypothetical protein
MTDETMPSERVRLLALVAEVEAGRFDAIEEVATRWAASVGVQRMMNAIASVFEKYGSQDIMDRFRDRLGAMMHLAFTEGAAQGVLQAKAALSEQPVPAVGWRLVPEEPTPEMLEAGEYAAWDYANAMPAIRAHAAAWSAMLSAAPAPSPDREGE